MFGVALGSLQLLLTGAWEPFHGTAPDYRRLLSNP